MLSCCGTDGLYAGVPFYLLEYPKMIASDDWSLDIPVLFANGCVAFFLNIAVFLVIGRTSAVTMRVAGVVKDWSLICLSALLFGAKISWLTLSGYGVAFIGVTMYNIQKQRVCGRGCDAKHSTRPCASGTPCCRGRMHRRNGTRRAQRQAAFSQLPPRLRRATAIPSRRLSREQGAWRGWIGLQPFVIVFRRKHTGDTHTRTRRPAAAAVTGAKSPQSHRSRVISSLTHVAG
eukprot:scaffold1219_cov400-Prasinococcus_capsulatus_cf.AAC.2